ncbi:MAG: hypothetical protein AB2L24_23835 [Mangrovibacterium sp.]
MNKQNIVKQTTNTLLAAFLLGTGCDRQREIINPYEEVSWLSYGQYKADLYTHTIDSGAWMNPYTLLNQYRNQDYHILSITDRCSATFPWEESSWITITGEVRKRIGEKIIKARETGMVSLGNIILKKMKPAHTEMIAIQTADLKYKGHGVSGFFSSYQHADRECTLDNICAKDGIVFLNRTERCRFPVKWYVDLYKRYNKLAGIGVFNCSNRFPDDRQLWDSLLTVLAPARTVWGLSNSGMRSVYGRNWNVFLLPELNGQQVRRAMEKGTFYFVNDQDGPNDPLPPVIRSIIVNRIKGTIELNAAGEDSIVWISNGERVGFGKRFRIVNLSEEKKYVRAELYGNRGRTIVATQPFMVSF